IPAPSAVPPPGSATSPRPARALAPPAPQTDSSPTARRAMTATHARPPLLQASAVVHALLSSHAVPLGLNPSAGQAVLAPVQVSATSHCPAAGRQTAPAFPAGCAQAPAPSHWSRLQGFRSGAHGVPAGSRQLWGVSLHVREHSGPLAHGSQ